MKYISEYKNLILRIGVAFYFIYSSIKILFTEKESIILNAFKLNNEIVLIILGVIFLIIGLMLLIGWFTKYLSYAGIVLILLLILSSFITKNFDSLFWKEITILVATIYLAEVGCTQYGLDELL